MLELLVIYGFAACGLTCVFIKTTTGLSPRWMTATPRSPFVPAGGANIENRTRSAGAVAGVSATDFTDAASCGAPSICMILSGDNCCATAPSRVKSFAVELDQPGGRFFWYQPTTSSKALAVTMALLLPYLSVFPSTL